MNSSGDFNNSRFTGPENQANKIEVLGGIYTIGHSTHSIDEFIAMLQSFSIKVVADIRNYPGSKRYPHFEPPNAFKSKSLKIAP